jgi:hypothetical protein
MAETAFDRTERGLGSADLSIPDIVARTKGNPQDIMKLVMNGQINVTQGLLAKRLSDSVVAERNAMAAQQPSVLQEEFPEMAQATGGLGAMPQAASPMPTQMGPQMGPQMGAPAPQGMPPAQGGIGGLDFAPAQMASGGIVGYNVGGTTAAPQTIMGIPPELLAQINPALDLDAAGAQLQGVLPTESEAREKLKARLGAGFDPEKERKRAELAGLFAGLGSIQPGMSPMEALVSGFVGGGKQIQESKKEMEAKEMELLKTSAELEEASNRTAREVYGLQLQLAEAKRRGASEAAQAEIEVRLAETRQEFQALENARDRATTLESARIGAASRGSGGDKGLSAGERTALTEQITDLNRQIVDAQFKIDNEKDKWSWRQDEDKITNQQNIIDTAKAKITQIESQLYGGGSGATGTRTVDFAAFMKQFGPQKQR